MLKQSFCGSNNLKCGKFHNQVVEHMETKQSEDVEVDVEVNEVDNTVLEEVVKHHQNYATCQEGEDEGITIDGVCVIDEESQKEQIKEKLSKMKEQSVLNYHTEHMIVTCKDDEGTEGGEIDGVCYVDPEKYANKVQEMIDASNADADDENEAALADLEALVKDVGGGDADVEKFLNEAFKINEGFSNKNFCTY